MSYKDLQKRATELGIQAVGVSADDLQKAIAEKEAEGKTNTPSTENETPKKEEKKADYNAAIVLRGNQEVRRYTLEIHGDKFEELANQFAGVRDFKVKLVTVEPGVVCPNCGTEFNPDNHKN